MTLSPLIWDACGIQIDVVRDGRKKIVAASKTAPWDGLPVWLASKAPRPAPHFSLTR